MTFVGIDLAWGNRARTGLAAVDDFGRLSASGSARTNDEIDEWLARYAPAPRVVGVDAPLIVPNETGMRRCESLIGDAYRRYGAGAYPSNRSIAHLSPPRAEDLAGRHGWRVDPSSLDGSTTLCIEVYPHAALVGLFELGYTFGYKKGAVASRRQQMLLLLELLETVPSLALGSNERWAEIRLAVDAAKRPVQLATVEDEVDPIVCAHVAWLFVERPEALTVYGDAHSGYIVAPPPPVHAPSTRVTATSASAVTDAQPDSLTSLTERLRAFADARDWHQFHTPKNLAMAIAGEAGELAAEFQWLDGEATRTAILEDAGLRDRVSQEMADVLIYLVRLADVAQIDVLEAANAKVDVNESRFPPSESTT